MSNLDDYGFEIYEENAFPIAYLLTFRTYGTWLHGDPRGSYQRSRDKRFGTIKIESNVPLNEKMLEKTVQAPVVLDTTQRTIVTNTITEVCEHRSYMLRAVNVRSNHVHAVISRPMRPEKIVNDLKSYATRRLREAGLAQNEQRIWARGGSTRYLWKPRHVEAAIEYVLYSQGDVPCGTVFEIE
jgi:REP element-mobilizing transposase RayT